MEKKNAKKSASIVATYGLALFIYIISFLLIPFDKSDVSWISFGFTILGFIVGLATCLYAFGSGDKLVSKVYGFPIFKVGSIYAAIQLALGIIICVIAIFVDFPLWLTWLLSLVLLAICMIGIIITDSSRDFVSEMDEGTKASTEAISYFRLMTTSIAGYCEDSALKGEIDKLSEAFRFSDPVSSAHTAESERRIGTMISELQVLVEGGNVAEASELVRKIGRVLDDRNRICKMYK